MWHEIQKMHNVEVV